jgi:uncharacterized protein YyaL (SSP411 family)
VDPEARDWIIDTLVHAAAQDQLSPSGLGVLLHHYADVDRADLREAVEHGLSTALEALDEGGDGTARIRWLGVVADAVAWSDDEVLPEAVQRHLAPAIDALEQDVRRSYEPGEGLLDRDLQAHGACAAALLTAFELTGRLPYSMLAEELTQIIRRRWWSDAHHGIPGDVMATAIASQLFCRLAALHRDPDYAQAAVVHGTPSYEADARDALAALQTTYRDHPAAAAEYGAALIAWFALNAP